MNTLDLPTRSSFRRTVRRVLSAVHLLLLSLVTAAFAWAQSTTVIVEFDEPAGAVWKTQLEQSGTSVTDDELWTYRSQLFSQQDAHLANLANSGIDFEFSTVDIPSPVGTATTVEHRFALVLNGAAIHVDLDDVAAVRAAPGVKAVHRLRIFQPTLDQSVAFTRANELYGAAHELTQYDDLREGYEGQGVIISVIDTGIEYQHAMFGGDPTPPRFGLAQSVALIPENEKIIYNMPYSDFALEDGFGHGTHVASTAAGYLGYTAGGDGIPLTADDIPVHGVAPQAKIMSYGVCSDALSTVGALTGTIGGCLNVNTIMALEDSVAPRTLTGFIKPVADVINLSLGGDFGSADDATAIAASNAGLLGAVVVAAAGNAGDVRSIVGSPSTGRHVVSVAAMTDPGSGATYFIDALSAASFPVQLTGIQAPASQYATDGPTQLTAFPMAGTPAPANGGIAQYLAYVEGALTAADYPASVNGRIAFIDGAGAVGAFAEAVANASANGAVAVLLFGTTENATAIAGTIPAAIIKPEVSDQLLELFDGTPVHGDVSAQPVRLDPEDQEFRSAISGFSSRGPVAGLGQIKPDLAAPGVNVLAALPPASVLGALGIQEQGVDYGAISGTSMASPHVAGIAALVYQSNPSWTPDLVRTALINTSTPMRDVAGSPEAYGPSNQKIHSQGGGAVDAFAAANARGLMGVEGDGVLRPAFLGSHSFGDRPVVNNQCVNRETVTVTLRDMRGTGGTYDLATFDNRLASSDGVELFLSTSQVTVPPGGEVTFEAGLEIDGSVLNGPREMQFYVVADRTDGTESLSMPMLYSAVGSAPAGGGTQVETIVLEGTVGAGSSEAGVGEQSTDVPFEVAPGTTRIVIAFDADDATSVAFPDLDLELLDPNGNVVGSSGNTGSIESIDAAVGLAGTYVLRVDNYLSVGASFTATVDLHGFGGAPSATLDRIATEHVDDNGTPVDFDGSFTLSWVGHADDTGYRIERSDAGGAWQLIDRVSAGTTTYTVSGLEDGEFAFRVTSEVPGVLCTFVTAPSNVEEVRVDRRTQRNATDSVDVRITSVSQVDGVFEVGIVLENLSAGSLLDPVTLEIVAINGDSSITVLNADEGGNGRDAANPAVFDYSAVTDGDGLAGGATSGARTVRFSNPNGRLFSFDSFVRGYSKPRTRGGGDEPN